MLEAIIEKVIGKKLGENEKEDVNSLHPMVGRRCIVRTYSAGVHFGKIVSAKGSEVHLIDAARLWKWEGGGLSLSAVNAEGMKGGRINITGEVYLTDAIELIPTTKMFEESWGRYVEK